jgi:hypothetical protein
VLETDLAPTTFILLPDAFLVRKNARNEPFHCFPMQEMSTQKDFLQHNYSIPSKGRWSSWEIFSPARGNPDSIIFTQKFGPALFVLEKVSPYLSVYDLDKGRQLNRLYLDPTVKYTSLLSCWHDLSRYVLQSSRASLPGSIALDFIVLEYPPLRPSFRCQVGFIFTEVINTGTLNFVWLLDYEDCISEVYWG